MGAGLFFVSSAVGLLAVTPWAPLFFVAWVALVIWSIRRLFRTVLERFAVPDQLLAEAAPGATSSRCPRCDLGVCASSGLCAPCMTALTVAANATAIMCLHADAVNRRDTEAAARVFNFPYSFESASTGNRGAETTSSDRFSRRAVLAAFPDLRLTCAPALAEPGDPSTAWVRVRLEGHDVRDGTLLDLERMWRLKLTGGKISEVLECRGMPRSTRSRAA